MKENKSIKNVNKKKGISLIVLVITIIVIVILAVAVILSIADNNPISNANKASFQNDVKSMQEELELIKASNYAESQGKDYGTISFDSLTGKDKYKEKFDIKNGELVYTSKLKGDELTWAKELGIASSAFVLDESVEGVTITEENGKKVFNTSWQKNYDTYKADYTEEIKNEEVLEIPDGVTEIAADALRFMDKKIILPNTITKVGTSAFSESSIEEVNLPNLITMGTHAFSMCNNLKEVFIPSSVESITAYAFYSSRNLSKVKLSEGIKEIGENAFTWTAIENIELPSSLKRIETSAFDSCDKLLTISIPDDIEVIDRWAFSGCSNLTVTISEETAKRLYPDITSEADLADKLGVASVVFK